MIFVDKLKYRMSINEQRMEARVEILGFVPDSYVPEYLEDIKALMDRIPTHNYLLIVDATHQAPLPRKTASELGPTMMIYTTLGFKNVRIVMPKSKISFVQVRNGLETVDFPGEVVNPSI